MRTHWSFLKWYKFHDPKKHKISPNAVKLPGNCLFFFKQLQESPVKSKFKQIARIGYIAKGSVYGITGILTFLASFNLGGQKAGKLEVLDFLDNQPFWQCTVGNSGTRPYVLCILEILTITFGPGRYRNRH